MKQNEKERMKKMNKQLEKTVKEKGMLWKEFCEEEDGAGIVEVILILVILIGIVLLFKENISEIVENAFKQINSDSKSIID